MTIMAPGTRWAALAHEVETALTALFDAQESAEPAFVEMLRYAVLGGGKRIRPVLCLAASEAVGADWQAALPAACALELLHAYSLVHDDLPAMDDDDTRRGRPSVHRAFGEANAILVGDALQADALGWVAEPRNWHATVGVDVQLAVVRELCQAVGSWGMVGGQYLDFAAREAPLDLAGLRKLHARKTGALLRASVVCGGLVGRASTWELAALGRFGVAFGALFQLTDDLLDTSNGELPLDPREAAVNYCAMLGEPATRKAIGDCVCEAREALETLGARAVLLQEMTTSMITRTY